MPQPLRVVTGTAAAMPSHNVDTDVIMPKRFLRIITREGLSDGVFADLRFTEDGEPNVEFVLNREPWVGARILVVGDNFGCGSSREHAVWGLYQLGIRVLIGTSFGGIFFDNSRRNGLAAITLDADARDRLLAAVSEPASAELTVDLDLQRIVQGGTVIPFQMPDDIRADLLEGRDAIATTLRHADAIHHFEAAYNGGYSLCENN
ncbi:MAG: 3-isopropylmalate dehydratase small subunit [Phycisphaeraceae bacterium]